jgi:hypothetical protein
MSTEEPYAMNHVDLICRCCGDGFLSDEGNKHSKLAGCGPISAEYTYERPPYSLRPANGYGLSCGLLGDTAWKPRFDNPN